MFGREVSDSTEVLLCLFVLTDTRKKTRRLRERDHRIVGQHSSSQTCNLSADLGNEEHGNTEKSGWEELDGHRELPAVRVG